MPLKPTQFIWQDGKLIPWEQAMVHVLTHALHYGSSVFEGIRSYKTPTGPIAFRLTNHIQRMFDSAKIYRLNIPYTVDEIVAACMKIIIKNDLGEGAYLRPLAFRGYGEMGVIGDPEKPANCIIAAWNWGTYLGEEALEKGVDVCVSSWQRVSPNTLPTLSKAGGNYLSSFLVSDEARRLGFHEGIALNHQGNVSEGAGENLFLVREGKIYTPPLSDSILGGLTRDTTCRLAESLGLSINEQSIPREMLYIADEIFLTGSAAEITPVRSVDRISVGDGQRGPVTERLQQEFFGLFNGSVADQWGWLEQINPSESEAQA